MVKNILALWGARDVLYTWTIREIKVRYTDTRLGLAWILIYPACWVAMFTVLFSWIFKASGAGIPYPLYVMAGLVPWFFFSNTVSNAVSSLRNNAHLIPKVYFPREILPLGSVLVGFLDLALYLVLVSAAMIYYRVGGGMMILMVIPILAGLAMLTLAVSLLASRFALFQREVRCWSHWCCNLRCTLSRSFTGLRSCPCDSNRSISSIPWRASSTHCAVYWCMGCGRAGHHCSAQPLFRCSC